MAHAENEVIIKKPAADVFSFLADGLNNPKWRQGVINIELSSGRAGQVGAKYKQELKGPGGRKIAGDYELTVVKPNQEISFAVIAGPARPTGNYYLEQVTDGTKLKFVLDYKPKGLAWLMGPMIQKTMNSEIAQLSNLKQVLES